MKASEHYFSVLLFITLYKVFLTFESVNEILKWDHSNESYWAVLSCEVDLTSERVGEIQSVAIQVKATGQFFHIQDLTD